MRKGRMVSRANALATRKIRKSVRAIAKTPGRNVMAINVDDESFKEGLRILERFPHEMKTKVVRSTGRAAAIGVRTAARALVEAGSFPREAGEGRFPGNSMETETYWKKSRKQQDRRAGEPSLVGKISIKEQRINNGYLHMTGPERPWGNFAEVLEYGGVINLWGKDRFYKLRPRPFMEPAGPGTQWAQKQAYLKKMKQEWANW